MCTIPSAWPGAGAVRRRIAAPPWGYKRLLEVLADPGHEEHAEMIEWTGGPIDPERFDPGEVLFTDPKERLECTLR